jgi:hypothetical protein
MNQRVKEIEAERDGHDKSDDRFAHGAPSSELPQSHRVDPHQRDDRRSENYEAKSSIIASLFAGFLAPGCASFRYGFKRLGIRIS